MAHFYGTVRGGRGTASRLGHKNTGLMTTAQTWQHTVTTRLWHDIPSGEDWLSVQITGSDGKVVDLYCGTLSGKNPVENMPQPVFTLQEIESAQEEIAGD